MKKKNMIILGSLLAVCILVGGYLLFLSGPVLWRFYESGSPSPEPDFVIFNPLRDKSPEVKVERVLESIRSGNCESALREFATESTVNNICKEKFSDKIVRWKLENRSSKKNGLELYYVIQSESEEFYSRNLWFLLNKKSGQWVIEDITALRY